MPTANETFTLVIDTSNTTFGAALFQFQERKWVFISYHSKLLPRAVLNFTITELKLTNFVSNKMVLLKF